MTRITLLYGRNNYMVLSYTVLRWRALCTEYSLHVATNRGFMYLCIELFFDSQIIICSDMLTSHYNFTKVGVILLDLDSCRCGVDINFSMVSSPTSYLDLLILPQSFDS
ncbi:hypothetical protein L2E82_13046 [Cichorium intybus]|uniref:Uncharacterized protein n=1 Tax=Cichorium intybus TaxID=13427 RepID=A0ACB9GHR9_CICIN|nr:hypothetical protein L2E82_13046 [Cichorium intybus]